MEIKYINLKKILDEYLPISKSQFYNYIKINVIPKPLKFGRTSVWEFNSLMTSLKDLPVKLEKFKNQDF